MTKTSVSTRTVSSGTSPLFLLFLVLLVLKLTGVITWSWWLVTLPLWGGLAIFLALVVIALIAALIIEFSGRR